MKTFSQWVAELEQPHEEGATDTGCVANFARPVLASDGRKFPDPIAIEPEDDKKKKKK